MKDIEVGDTITFKGVVVGIHDGLLSFAGPTVRMWRGDSRIVDVESPATHGGDICKYEGLAVMIKAIAGDSAWVCANLRISVDCVTLLTNLARLS